MNSPKNILVTGASRGVGAAICRTLLQEGHTVFGVSRTLSAEITAMQSDYSDTFFFKSVDLANTSAMRTALFVDFLDNSKPLHGYVNNAAQAYDDLITNLSEEKLQSMFSVNVLSPMMITKYAIRNMILNRVQGSIVHISSVSAHTGYKGLAMYAASKGAIEAFSLTTAREWGEKGIRSNCIVAGFMETEMSIGLSPDQKNRIYNRTSLKKATSIQSLADTVSFLLSHKAESITGTNVFVDNGTI
ncbi:MAG: SDR family oxidoreductase [Bacteroidetes bacterium]|nr:MAG: SDR family oxidoreductase [Bacteroidota bacterium]